MDFAMSISGPGRVNQLGGLYINGKPLPNETRKEIIDLARLGVRPCDISRRLKVTHGCISKLLSKYQKTGSMNPGGANVGRPRVITPRIEQKIEQYLQEQPGIFSWELRDRLLREDVCSRDNLPSLSSISRIIKQKMITGVSSYISPRFNGQILDSRVSTDCGESQHDLNDQGLAECSNEDTSVTGKVRFMVHRKRRQRAKYTIHQLRELEMEFERNPYPNAWDRERLAQRLGIHETRIQVWFSNRRAKGRRKPSLNAQERHVTPSVMCTCHKYPARMLAPWMIESGSSRLLFPQLGYWEYESP